MSTKKISQHDVPAGEEARNPRKHIFWRSASVCGFTLSAVCFMTAAILSLLTATAVIVSAAATANLTVLILIAGFASAFFGAHSLDKMEETPREKPVSRIVRLLYEIFTSDARG